MNVVIFNMHGKLKIDVINDRKHNKPNGAYVGKVNKNGFSEGVGISI